MVTTSRGRGNISTLHFWPPAAPTIRRSIAPAWPSWPPCCARIPPRWDYPEPRCRVRSSPCRLADHSGEIVVRCHQPRSVKSPRSAQIAGERLSRNKRSRASARNHLPSWLAVQDYQVVAQMRMPRGDVSRAPPAPGMKSSPTPVKTSSSTAAFKRSALIGIDRVEK